jgi:hypothetical protein
MSLTALTITALITRANVGSGLADLDLNDHVAYDLVSYGPGGRVWVWDWASAPSVHGEQPVSGRMGNAIAPVMVRVKASSRATFETRQTALVAAFSQLRYHLKFSIDAGTVEEWKCFAANLTPSGPDGSQADGSWDKLSQMAGYHQTYSLQVVRHPVPVTGVM